MSLVLTQYSIRFNFKSLEIIRNSYKNYPSKEPEQWLCDSQRMTCSCARLGPCDANTIQQLLLSIRFMDSNLPSGISRGHFLSHRARSRKEWCLILAQVSPNGPSGVSREHFLSHRARSRREWCLILAQVTPNGPSGISREHFLSHRARSRREWCMILAQVAPNGPSGVSREHFLSHRARSRRQWCLILAQVAPSDTNQAYPGRVKLRKFRRFNFVYKADIFWRFWSFGT